MSALYRSYSLKAASRREQLRCALIRFRTVMLSATGAPGRGRFCVCRGGEAKHPRTAGMKTGLQDSIEKTQTAQVRTVTWDASRLLPESLSKTREVACLAFPRFIFQGPVLRCPWEAAQ
jgi:hypothetical protein